MGLQEILERYTRKDLQKKMKIDYIMERTMIVQEQNTGEIE